MMSMPVVSVIIPTHNRCGLLKDAITSVQSQTFSDWELIVIDDGSKDRTREVVEDFQRIDSRIRYVWQLNAGLSKTRERSISLVRGKYITFLDDDDQFFPEKLEKQVSFLEAKPEVGLVYSYVEMVDLEGNFRMLWPYKTAGDFLELIEESLIQTNSMLVRKTCFDQLGSFNGSFSGCDDYEMVLRISRSFPITFLPIRVGTYRWHESNMSHYWKVASRDRVRIYKELLKKGLSEEEKAKVIQSALRVTYVKAIDALDAGQYGKAAFYYWMAVYFNPLVGLMIPWTKFKNRLYRFLKPYLAMGYCSLLSLVSRG